MAVRQAVDSEVMAEAVTVAALEYVLVSLGKGCVGRTLVAAVAGSDTEDIYQLCYHMLVHCHHCSWDYH